jgi:hypothetical protein
MLKTLSDTTHSTVISRLPLQMLLTEVVSNGLIKAPSSPYMKTRPAYSSFIRFLAIFYLQQKRNIPMGYDFWANPISAVSYYNDGNTDKKDKKYLFTVRVMCILWLQMVRPINSCTACNILPYRFPTVHYL